MSKRFCKHQCKTLSAISARLSIAMLSIKRVAKTSIFFCLTVVFFALGMTFNAHSQSFISDVSQQKFNQKNPSHIINITLEPLSVIYPLSEKKEFSIQIKNTGNIQYPLNIADEYELSFSFIVYDKNGVQKIIRPEIIQERIRDNFAYRNFILLAGETLTFPLFLDDFIDFDASGVYRIEAQFFPEFYFSDTSEYYLSNAVLVSLIDIAPNDMEINADVDIANINDYSRNIKQYNPDDVVAEALVALQTQNEDLFFYHVNDELLYLNNVDVQELYSDLTREERIQEIARFRTRLFYGINQSDLAPPDYFEVVKTSYTKRNATVTVLSQFMTGRVISNRRFEFFLEKAKDEWKITDYSVTLISRELAQKNLEQPTFIEDDNYELLSDF